MWPNVALQNAYITLCLKNAFLFLEQLLKKQPTLTSCRRAAATICPRPSPPAWAPKCLAPPSRRQRSSCFLRPRRSHARRYSCLTRQHGGEQSGLVTLTYDLLTLKVVPESRVTWATSVPILVFLCLSILDLGPMYATDRQTDVRQHHRLMPPPIRGGGIIIFGITQY